MQVEKCMRSADGRRAWDGRKIYTQRSAGAVIILRARRRRGVVIDGAHNTDAVAELARNGEKHYPHEDITALTAIMRDKDIEGIAEGISSFANRGGVHVCRKKRGLPARELAPYFDHAVTMEDPDYAFREARRLAEQKKGILVVCGSFIWRPMRFGN